MKKGDLLTVSITDYAFEGKGIAKINIEGSEDKKLVVFVNGGYPGDTLEVVITKYKKTYAEASLKTIITPSPVRTEPKCSYTKYCGGCKQQNMIYENQAIYKQAQVKDIFERLGGLYNFEFENIVKADTYFYYRNKMEYSFAVKRWLTPEEINDELNIEDRDFALGMHLPNMYDKVLDIKECFLQSELSNNILNFTRDYFKNKGISIYSTKTHKGLLRNLVIRTAYNTKDVMVNLVTSDENDELMQDYCNKLINNYPEVTTFINNISKKKASIAFGDYEKIYFGSGVNYDYIGRYKFRISANSFFQTNTKQAEKLYSAAKEFADIKGTDIVYDLYCGAGTISIFVSDKANKVYGFETVEPAIKDGEINISINDINNVKLFTADLNKSFLEIVKNNNTENPDIIIADPPRSGMNPTTVKDILKLSPKKIVYVSCNPATQARDIKLLIEGGYKLLKAKPVDMFPHTYHIENVALLEK